MIEFDKSFFLGETRDDFYIEPMMKCAWAAQMEVLQVVQQICDKHDIRYFVFDGTLLGAVRHQGYIPWDDDMDICMLRKDYERFLTLAPAELTGEYRISSPYNCGDYEETFARICNASTIDYGSTRLLNFHGFPYIAGIDIFPLDTIPCSPGERDAFIRLYDIVSSCFLKYKQDPDEVMSYISDIEELCHTKIDQEGNILNQLCRLTDTICQAYKDEDSPYLSRLAFHNSEKVPLCRDWFSDYILLPFENIRVPAPIGYDQILTAIYGDYMTPVRTIGAHGYPFYEGQRKEMKEKLTERIVRGENPFASLL